MAFEEDLDLFLEDFGIDASWNGITTKVIFDQPGEYELAEMQVSDEHTIRFKTSAWPGIAHGVTPSSGVPGIAANSQPSAVNDCPVVIGEKTFAVRQVRMLEDGAYSRAWLSQE